MVTAYSPILKLALPVQGELSGTWGDVVNDNITSMVEQAIAGRAVIDTWTTNSHVLTTANGTTSESRCAMLEFTDTGTALSGAGTVTCPTLSKIYIAKNASGQNVTLKTSGGTGILVPNGRTMFLFCDGTNVVEAVTSTTSLQLGTSTIVTAVLDEDNMASDSATSLATQQSIKAYVDSQVGANNELSEVLANGNTSGANDIIMTSGQKITVDTIDETTAAAGVTIDSVLLKDDGVNATNLEITNIKANDGTAAGSIADSTGVVTVLSSILTTADINGGTADGVIIGGTTPAAATVTNLIANTDLIIAGTTTITAILDEDNMASDSATALATQQSIKAYVDAQVGTVDTLAEILAIGNTTGGTDLAVSTGDDITFADSSKAIFGDGSDLQIYHDGSHSYIKDAGDGQLRLLAGTNVQIWNSDATNLAANFNGDTQTAIYYAGEAKLTTTSTGIDVTGDITLGDTNPTITFNDSSIVSLSHTVSSASDNLRLAVDVNGVDAGSRVEIFDGSTEVARFSSGAVLVTGTVTAEGLTVENSSLDVVFKDTQTHTTTDGPALQFQGKGPNGTNYNFGYVQGLSNGVNNAGDIVIGTNTAGVSYQRLRIEDNGDISFYEDTGTTAKFFWDASLEALGVGITPSTAMHVYSASGNTALRVETGLTNGQAQINFKNDARRYNVGINSSDNLVFEDDTAGLTRMTIDSSGNVGIGTSSPLTTLHVNSTYGTGYTGAFSGVSSYNPTSSEMLIGTFLGSAASAGDYTGLRFNISGNGSGVASAGIIASREAAEGNGNTSLSFLTRTTTSSLTERLRIDSSGNVLVGKTTTAFGTQGIRLEGSNGKIEATRNGNVVMALNRLTSDGTIAEFAKDGTTVGSIGTEVTDITLQADLYVHARSTADGSTLNDSRLWLLGGDSGIVLDGHTNAILPTDENSYEDNRTNIGSSDYRFKDLYLSGGVVFGDAGGSGTSSSNSLDSYEEGTWTPVITPEGGSAASITVNSATYTKVGRLVSLVFRLAIDSISGTGSSNAIELTGMPFTINDASSGGANIGYTNLTASMTGTLALQGNTTTKYRIVNLNGVTSLNASDHLTGGSTLKGQFIYHSV
jgi:hypothetical protein